MVSENVVGIATEPLADSIQEKVAEATEIIMRGLGDKPLRMCVGKSDNPFNMYQKLKERYAIANVATRVQLLSRPSKLRYESQPMADHIDSFEEFYNRLEASSCRIEEEVKVATLLASFGDRNKSPYGNLVIVLQTNAEGATWETISAKLLQEYDDKSYLSPNALVGNGEGDALYANFGNRSRGAYRGPKQAEKRTCYECGKIGHIARNCYSKKNNKDNHKQDAHIADASVASEAKVLLAKETGTGGSKQCDIRQIRFQSNILLDSGASECMVSNGSYLHNVRPIPPKRIVLGNRTVIMATMQGNLLFKGTIRSNGEQITRYTWMMNGLHVPELESDLVSVSTLCKQSFSVRFSPQMCNEAKEGTLRAQGYTYSGVYYLDGSWVPRSEAVGYEKTAVARATAAMTQTEVLWHNRLGHAHVNSIRRLARDRTVEGLNLRDEPRTEHVCEDCMRGKHARAPSGVNWHRSSTIGRVTHSDVCGPMSVESPGGSRYYVLFIDEFSGYATVILIASKSDVLLTFNKFHPWFERHFAVLICRLHRDQGGEYFALKKYLEEKGIEQTFSPAYSPAQNSIAERLNRTIVEGARAFLSHAGLPHSFWAEAVVHTTDIRNRFSGPNRNEKSSWELATASKPRVDHLRVFGCLAWVHVPKEKIKKLDFKSEKGLLLGCKDSGLYKVWLLESKSTVLVRNVKFSEDIFSANQDIVDDSDEEERTVSTTESQEELSVGPAEPTLGNTPYAQINFGVPSDTGVEPVNNGDEGDDGKLGLEDLTYYPSTQTTPQSEPLPNSMPDSNRAGIQPSRYLSRERKQTSFWRPNSHSSVAQALSTPDPRTVNEALSGSESDQWREAIDEELSSLEQHRTWDKAHLPAGCTALPTKFVFRRKHDEEGNVSRWKARLVVQGFWQGFVEDTYAPVAEFSTVRTLLSVAIQKGYLIHQLDVKTAFLHGDLQEEIYVLPSKGTCICNASEVFRLRKGLYGLRQAPRVWYDKWCDTMERLGFETCKADDCLFHFSSNGNEAWILLYVDDVILVGSQEDFLKNIKSKLELHLDLKDLGTLHSFLGVTFLREGRNAWLTQEHFILQVLVKFQMSSCNPAPTPMCVGGFTSVEMLDTPVPQVKYQELLGILLFLSTRTRPDIALAVGILCRYSSAPKEVHWVALKRILRYLKGTLGFGLKLRYESSGKEMVVFCDADWAGDVVSRRSTSGVLLKYGVDVVDGLTVRQHSIALSSTEAEHIALSEAGKKVVWMRMLLYELGAAPKTPTVVYNDNNGALVWSSEGIRKAKHISIRRNYVKELSDQNFLTLKYCPTTSMTADILTKPLKRVKFCEHRRSLSVLPIDPQTE